MKRHRILFWVAGLTLGVLVVAYSLWREEPGNGSPSPPRAEGPERADPPRDGGPADSGPSGERTESAARGEETREVEMEKEPTGPGLRLQGTVESSDGELLSGVRVALRGRGDTFADTNHQGAYLLELGSEPVPAGATVRFYLRGYQEHLAKLPAVDPESAPLLDLDAVLRDLENAALASGLVRTERGDLIGGASVTLSQRRGERYQAESGPDGKFAIPGVQIGEGYFLRVIPPVPFSEYSRREVRVSEEGVTLEVVLDTPPTVLLRGRMLDPEGNAIPGLRLWIGRGAGVRGAVAVIGDEGGYFTLNQAPVGPVTFDSHGSPRLRVTGVNLPDSGGADVRLVFDSGDYQLAGRVLDDRGEPVAGADVVLTWSRDEAGIHSTSNRELRSGDDGRFRFLQLGPGRHTLEVTARGHASVVDTYVVGSFLADVQVRLSSSAR